MQQKSSNSAFMSDGHVDITDNGQGRIKLFGAPRHWKHLRPLFKAVFLSGGGYYPLRLIQTPRFPVPRQK